MAAFGGRHRWRATRRRLGFGAVPRVPLLLVAGDRWLRGRRTLRFACVLWLAGIGAPAPTHVFYPSTSPNLAERAPAGASERQAGCAELTPARNRNRAPF